MSVIPAASKASTGGAAVDVATAADSLWQQITERYDAAQKHSAATMTETNTEVVEDGGVKFVLRVAARLRDKPKPPADANGPAKKEWRNPFLPYEQALWVADLGPTHVLLLNKFNIVPWHCLVVTSEFQRQEEDLTAADLAATWRVMQSMPRGGLAFYNCGPCSGASQPHKHVQIVPLPLDDTSSSSTSSSDGDGSSFNDGTSGRARPPIWPAVAAATGSASGAPTWEPAKLRSLPFAAFAIQLQPPQGSESGGSEAALPGDVGAYLAGVYQQLLAPCRACVEAKTGRQGVSPLDGSLSYNVVLTSDFMMLVPRRAEGSGPVSCNSVAFAGSIFVRSREEQQYVVQRGPMRILTGAAYEW